MRPERGQPEKHRAAELIFRVSTLFARSSGNHEPAISTPARMRLVTAASWVIRERDASGPHELRAALARIP